MLQDRPLIQLTAVWLALLALLTGTMVVSLFHLGVGNVLANMTIAFLKAALVGWFFIHLREMSSRIRLFALGALTWLGLLFALSMTDWLFR